MEGQRELLDASDGYLKQEDKSGVLLKAEVQGSKSMIVWQWARHRQV